MFVNMVKFIKLLDSAFPENQKRKYFKIKSEYLNCNYIY